MAMARIRRSMLTTCTIIRHHPAAALVPLLVCSLCSVAGVLVVYFVARGQEHARRTAASHTAMQAASSLQLQLMSMVQPVATMTAFLSSGLGMNYTLVQQLFPAVAAKLLAQVASPSDDMQLQLQPQAVITSIYPWNEFTETGYGLDLLGLPFMQNTTLGIMSRANQVTINGPLQFAEGYISMKATMPVFISGVERDFNFSSPWPESPYCPPSLCWQEANKTKFWGTVAGTWPLQDMLRQNVPLMRLQSEGFRFVLWQPAANASMPATPGYGDDVLIARSDNGDVRDAVHVPVDLNTDLSFQAAPWVLSVSPDSGWSSSWEVPLYVAVVVISLVIALLLMALMVSRVEHQDLLFSLVPKKVVQQLQSSGAIGSSTSRAGNAIPAGSTPAEVLLTLLADCLLGNLPRPALVVQLRAVLLGLQDIYRPAHISQELLEACLDDDVAHNLAHLLSDDALMDWDRRSMPRSSSFAASTSPALSSSNAMYKDLESSLAILVAGLGMVKCEPKCERPERIPSSPSLTNLPQPPKGSRRLSMISLEIDAAAVVSGPNLPSLSALFKASSSVTAPSKTAPKLAIRRAQEHASLHVDGVLSRTASSPCVVPAKVPMTRAVPDQLLSLLGQAYSSWTFDAFALDRESQGHALSTLGFYLMDKTGLMQQFKLQPGKVARFFQALEASYLANPYHSRTHAADVLQTLHVVLSRGGFLHSYADPARHLACILAAAAHDVEHVGLTNDFLCSSEDALALRYNDRSPSENHHAATLFTLLKLPNHDFLKHLGRETRDLIRKVSIEMVMATDMKQHMTLVSQFKSVHANKGSRISGVDGPAAETAVGPQFIDETERLLSLQMAMKVADLGHLAESLEVHKKWVAALETEFFKQGDMEREAGMPITPLFDRSKPGVTKSQVGFFDFVVMPLFSSFADVFEGVQPLVDGAAENLRFWKKSAEEKK